MNMRKVLTSLIKEIADEADRNPAFMERLQNALIPTEKAKTKSKTEADKPTPKLDRALPKRPSNRRQKAELDPVNLAREGEGVLREALSRLDIEKLRNVVAEYGMDTGKIVMKWRTPDRVIDRIVEIARLRAQKGNAFRDHPADEVTQEREPEAERSPASGSEDVLPFSDPPQSGERK